MLPKTKESSPQYTPATPPVHAKVLGKIKLGRMLNVTERRATQNHNRRFASLKKKDKRHLRTLVGWGFVMW